MRNTKKMLSQEAIDGAGVISSINAFCNSFYEPSDESPFEHVERRFLELERRIAALELERK